MTSAPAKRKGRRPRVPKEQGYAKLVNKGHGVRYVEVGVPFSETGEVDVWRRGSLKSIRPRGRPSMLNQKQRTFAGYLMAITVGDLEARYGVRAPLKAAMRVIAGLRKTVSETSPAERHKPRYVKAADLLAAIEQFHPDDERRAKALARVFKDSSAIGRAKS
jgi:hypothetical protein